MNVAKKLTPIDVQIAHAYLNQLSKMAGSCPVVNVAGTTVAVRVLSSGTQAVNQASPHFSQGQAISRGNVGTPTSSTMIAGTHPAGPSRAHSGPAAARQSTTTVQVSCL